MQFLLGFSLLFLEALKCHRKEIELHRQTERKMCQEKLFLKKRESAFIMESKSQADRI